MAKHLGMPLYFYTDSASNTLNSWWTATGKLKWSWPFTPLTGFFYRFAVFANMDLLYATVAVNSTLAVIALAALYSAAARLDGRETGALACGMALCLPAFSRLAFSGNYEMTAITFSAIALWLLCAEAAGLLAAASILAAMNQSTEFTSRAALGTYGLYLIATCIPRIIAHGAVTIATTTRSTIGPGSLGMLSQLGHLLSPLWSDPPALLMITLTAAGMLASPVRRRIAPCTALIAGEASYCSSSCCSWHVYYEPITVKRKDILPTRCSWPLSRPLWPAAISSSQFHFAAGWPRYRSWRRTHLIPGQSLSPYARNSLSE
jgi:hypothetical protein